MPLPPSIAFIVGHRVEVSLEPVQALRPQTSIGLQPLVKLAERLRADPVDAALRLGPDGDQPGLAQHPQVLRDGRLAHLELADERSDRTLLHPEEIEYSPA